MLKPRPLCDLFYVHLRLHSLPEHVARLRRTTGQRANGNLPIEMYSLQLDKKGRVTPSSSAYDLMVRVSFAFISRHRMFHLMAILEPQRKRVSRLTEALATIMARCCPPRQRIRQQSCVS